MRCITKGNIASCIRRNNAKFKCIKNPLTDNHHHKATTLWSRWRKHIRMKSTTFASQHTNYFQRIINGLPIYHSDDNLKMETAVSPKCWLSAYTSIQHHNPEQHWHSPLIFLFRLVGIRSAVVTVCYYTHAADYAAIQSQTLHLCFCLYPILHRGREVCSTNGFLRTIVEEYQIHPTEINFCTFVLFTNTRNGKFFSSSCVTIQRKASKNYTALQCSTQIQEIKITSQDILSAGIWHLNTRGC